MKNEYYSWYKEHHICPLCRVNKPGWLWVEEHRCYLCGEPAIEGHKLCQKHYDESCKGLEKARSVAKEAKIGLHAPFTFGGGKA